MLGFLLTKTTPLKIPSELGPVIECLLSLFLFSDLTPTMPWLPAPGLAAE